MQGEQQKDLKGKTVTEKEGKTHQSSEHSSDATSPLKRPPPQQPDHHTQDASSGPPSKQTKVSDQHLAAQLEEAQRQVGVGGALGVLVVVMMMMMMMIMMMMATAVTLWRRLKS